MSPVNRAWTIGSLLAIVAQLGMIRGFSVGLILLFVVPSSIAFFASSSSVTSRGRLLANIFLTLIGFGLVVARIPRLFPDLGGFDPKLPVQSDRALAWYGAVYMIFCVILPIHAFTRELEQHRLGLPTQVSRTICVMGLGTATIMLPVTIWVIVRFLHLLPVFR